MTAPGSSQTKQAKQTKPRVGLNRRAVIAVVCAVAAVAVLVWSLWETPSTPMAYQEFAQKVAQQQVDEAQISQDSVYFTLKDDETHALYRTDNPDSPDLKERLLVGGAQVTSSADAGDVVDTLINLLLDAFILGTFGIAIYKLASYSRNTFKVVRKTGVTFDDIAGMDGLKREMRQVVGVLKDPAAARRLGVRPVKGIVLEGPPGNGKTLFAKALAQEAGVNFIATKGADFQSAFMSLGARKIRSLFKKAGKHRPCIVFIDEFDSIGERRNYAGTGIDKENNRIITAMLNEMDGFTTKDGILVVAATNSYRSLDPALVRPGRFDLKYTVSNPDVKTREELIRIYSQGKSLAKELAPARLALLFEGASCADVEATLNEAAMLAVLEKAEVITLELVIRAAEKVGVKLKI